ncbi:MAG: hypothetical protein IIC56_06965, partial [Proteobacteria bacterium]|nr:hypothetical protein [Pseudomonadota bacterium]
PDLSHQQFLPIMSPLALGFSYRSMLDLRRISQLVLAFTVLVGAPVAAAWHWQCPDGGRCIQGEDAAYYCPSTEEAAASCCKPAVLTKEKCAHGHLPAGPAALVPKPLGIRDIKEGAAFRRPLHAIEE